MKNTINSYSSFQTAYPEMHSLQLIAETHESFASRYFDYQSAYRYALTLFDGETVEITAYKHYQGSKPTSLAIDVSTMVGCPVRCKFCDAGAIKHVRKLNSTEMCQQILHLAELHDLESFPQINCSFQGIGEPSLVSQEVLDTAKYLTRWDSRVRISIATTATSRQAITLWGRSDMPFENLQISCSATSNNKARWLSSSLPDPKEIFEIAKYAKRFSNFNKVKINYILISGFNDTDSDLNELIELATGSNIIVKVSTLNATDTSQRFGLNTAEIQRAQTFVMALQDAGIDSYIYGTFRGTDISCGQLILRKPAIWRLA